MEFEDFWKQYPRKVNKHMAREVWKRLTPQERSEALKNVGRHVRYWELKGTEQDYIPHGRTWLSQRRWEDELEVEAVPKTSSAWWTSEEATMAKAREFGMAAQGGEDWNSFRKRIADRIRAAA